MDIVEFLNARMDEEEQAAREADEYSRRVNGPDRPDVGLHLNMDIPALIVDERRVLRDIEAKRLMIEDLDYGGGEMGDARDHVIRRLASVYAEHPDYDPDWAPVT